MRRAAFAVCLLSAATLVSAAEIRSINVSYDDGLYEMVSEAWIDAGLDETYEVFTTWDYSERFSSAIVEARDTMVDGQPGYYIVNRGCILFFCKSLVRSGRVEREHNRVMRAWVDPEKSDFRRADEIWEFSEHDGGTRVVYRLKMIPGFWVPPAIGPYLIKRKLGNDGGDALNRIEEIARELETSSGHVVG